jgi:hypothetical protein
MKKRNWLAGVGVLGACALCCAIPLIGGAAALGISAFFLEPIVLAVMALVLVVGGFFFFRQRKASGAACARTGCGCNSCAGK